MVPADLISGSPLRRIVRGALYIDWKGRYETYPSGIATFYGMAYVAHPVYADPGSNGWIGNQVWSTQRIAELYYAAQEDGNTEIANRCKVLLDKWVGWFADNLKWNAPDGDGLKVPFQMPSTLAWGDNALEASLQTTTSHSQSAVTAIQTLDA